MNEQRIRVLIVDDSYFMLVALKTILESDNQIEVIASAKSGLEAITKIKELQPDVITIDINMPYLDGIKSIQLIMAECPVPIIVISAYITDKESEKTIAALSAGAVDYIGKPDGEVSTTLNKYSEIIINKVKIAASANVKKIQILSKKNIVKAEISDLSENIILVGISTGGPSTLKQLLSLLKPNLDFSMIIAIHITEMYSQKLSELLDEVCPYKVQRAEEGLKLKRGNIYVCSSGHNTELTFDLKLKKTPVLPKQVYIPSADVLFNSALKHAKIKNVLGMVLTGMGNDGSKGIIELYNSGASVVIQDEKSSVLYGMPKSAKQTGCYHYELALSDMPDLIEKFTQKKLMKRR
ncbi:MAG TPA: chemotaxis-specific protein-glutamate methyltransferase CheB [bacterium]|nr:chemotaxis-specific protein-glutamate methyltransferase CheB [bacterium]